MRSGQRKIRAFLRKLGPVEQAQVVSSTAVIVSMSTIIASVILTGQEPRLMDFISILTIGLIGFVSVYFSLTYGRRMEEQQQELVALNTITEAVTRVVRLDTLLQTALDKTTELLGIPYGWVYMLEEDALRLKCSRGTRLDVLSLVLSPDGSSSAWLHQPHVEREHLEDRRGAIPPPLKEMGIQFWASIPLRSQDGVTGTLVVAGPGYAMFTERQAELMESFGNQISVAVHNARLFERLQASERQYADLYENAPDLYLTVTRDGHIIACNTTGAAALGLPRDGIIGRPLTDLFEEERRPAVEQHLRAMFETNTRMADVEERMSPVGGEPIQVSLNSSLVCDAAGKAVSARLIARDITERKRMEAAILHAQKIDSIGSLAGGIAHDFNNILASILGAASIMRRRMSEEEKFYKYVSIIEGAAKRGSSLTRQLLTFARKGETSSKAVDVNGIVRETLHLFERSVSKEIEIVARLTDDSVLVNGDEGQIQQAVLNLLLNARDAMPRGGTLTITTSAFVADARTTSQFTSVKPGPFVGIRVEDTGVGIEQSVQGRIFEPFFTTKDNGTGLGLSVLYGVVQSHGGFLTLESRVGQGSAFAVCFPRSDARAVAARDQRRRRIPGGREHILLIDDEESVREIARDMLSDLGYTVTVYPDGRSGVEAYRNRQASVDLILLDVNMPHMSGAAAFEALRSINPRVRIIIVTGYGRKVIDAASFPGEVNGFVQKPFQLEELASRVRHVLDTRMVETESPS
ncbi:MAG: response regulator [Bacteroidota bacterium]